MHQFCSEQLEVILNFLRYLSLGSTEDVVRSWVISNYLFFTFSVQTSGLRVNTSCFKIKTSMLLFDPWNERFIRLRAWKISDM